MTAASPSITAALDDPSLFKNMIGDPASWNRRRVLLKAAFGEPLAGDEELEIYRHHTGRTKPPEAPFREIVEITGRRGGKTRMAALCATFLASFVDYSPFVSAGGVVTIALIATDRRQARNARRYIEGFYEIPLLAEMLDGEPTADVIALRNGVNIEILTASTSSSRGYTYGAVIADELAFWRSSDDSANPAADILRALRPGLATIPTSKLIIISTPYAKNGPLYNAYCKHFGVDDSPVLVWRATTQEMNPTIDAAIIQEAIAEDPESAASEYFAEFRSDISSFVSREAIDAVVVSGRTMLPPVASVNYICFLDAAAGAGRDSFTMAIAHKEGDRRVLDLLVEKRPPFSPDDVTKEFVQYMRQYRITHCTADKWGGLWVSEAFSAHHIRIEQCAKPKSDLYKEFLPLLNSGRVELLDNTRLINQLASLERRTARGGRDTIDHPSGANSHDDCINAAVGSLVAFGASNYSLEHVGALGSIMANDDFSRIYARRM